MPSELPVLRAERTSSRHLEVDEAPMLLEYLRSCGHRYEPPPPPEMLTLEACQAACARAKREFAEGTAVNLYLFSLDGAAIVGELGVAHIRRGLRFDCVLCYAIHPTYEGQGMASEAVRALISYVFEELGLHRIEASHSPTNGASACSNGLDSNASAPSAATSTMASAGATR
jgi:ribosomal-protein-alanine N-acetyltransferase